MKKQLLTTTFRKFSADVYTPVGIYLRLRDRFRDTILLESTDDHAGENSYSIIGVNAIAGIEIKDAASLEIKFPGSDAEKTIINKKGQVVKALDEFLEIFQVENPEKMPVQIAQSVFGYTSYEAVQFFDNIDLGSRVASSPDLEIPLMRYRLYQYVIIINHYKDEIYLCENHFAGIESRLADVETGITSRDIPAFPFTCAGKSFSGITDEAYKEMVIKGIAACQRGDVFQVVLSRQFQQAFHGDEFNVYRALRNVNPSPYLFYFDYGDYRLMGSSPESQFIIKDGKAVIHTIAGTFRRTGNDIEDAEKARMLEADKKENAEHVMLVDLARNDLSRVCDEVEVSSFKKIQLYSHVIHMVSEVTGKLKRDVKPYAAMASSFPAGTLSGAPKIKAMQIIHTLEKHPRGFYGGAIGYMGLNGNCNHAIMIRSFLSRNNNLVCQAGAGITVSSNPENELAEVENKLGALHAAVERAAAISTEKK